MQVNESLQLEIVWAIIDLGVLVDAGHNDENGVTFSNEISLSVNSYGCIM